MFTVWLPQKWRWSFGVTEFVNDPFRSILCFTELAFSFATLIITLPLFFNTYTPNLTYS